MTDVDSLLPKSCMMPAIFPLHAILFNCLRSTQMKRNYIGSTLCMKLILWEEVVSHYETIFSKFCFERYDNPAKWEHYGDNYSIITLSSKDLYIRKIEENILIQVPYLSFFRFYSRLLRTHDLVLRRWIRQQFSFSRCNYTSKRRKWTNNTIRSNEMFIM